MSTNKGLTGEWINVFMCTSLHQGTSVLQEYRVIPLVHHIRKSFEQVWTYMKWTHLNKFWTSLNTFQHIWTSFKQVWSHLNKFWTSLNTNEHIWTHIITLEQVLNKFEHKWTHLDIFELIWTSEDDLMLHSDKNYKPVRAAVIRWTELDFEESYKICGTRFKQNYFHIELLK